MIYKTFEDWKAGQWLEDGEPRTEAYTEDELLLVEMGWKYGFDAGKQQTKPLSDEEIGDCVDDYFGLMALQHKYIYDIDQIQEYGLKLARAIEERHGIK